MPARCWPRSARCASCATTTPSSPPPRPIVSIFTNAVAALTKKARGLEAPFAAADAVGAAIDLPFDEGLKKEREGFLKLVSSDQSKAQRYAFFAEREAAKIAGVPEGTKPRKVERVAIIGAGTMGGGIAMSFANAGIPVTLIETGEEQLKRGMGVMQKNYEATAARGGIPADAPAKRMGLITGKVGLENVKDADLDHRGRVRDHGDQEGSVRARSTSSPSPARCWPPTPPISTSTRSRR